MGMENIENSLVEIYRNP